MTNLKLLSLLIFFTALPAFAQDAEKIDRQALVERHAMHFDRYTPEAPASVGNGEFAFTFDVTGLQTFPSDQPGHIPLGTMTQWAWHRFPGGEHYRYEDTLTEFDVHGRKVTYSDQRNEPGNYFRMNPHRLNLAQPALRLVRADGTTATVGDLQNPTQTVSLWTGEAVSRFTFEGQPVVVHTLAHPTLDAIAVRIESPMVATGQVGLELRFSYPSGSWGPVSDAWDVPEKHESRLSKTDFGARIERTLDALSYVVDVHSAGESVAAAEPHRFLVSGSGDALEAVIHFPPQAPETTKRRDFIATQTAAAEAWRHFWNHGAVVDLSQSTDPRWRELERRIVQSQYVTAINCAGSMPPQETGLVCNSWYGKSHLEMHWWHAVHFALWGRPELLERSMDWYETIMPKARDIAQRQGYRGVRWPKMTGIDGVSSPSEVGEFLIWQQPHPIYLAELLYRCDPSKETLQRYRTIVEESAEFMADYAFWDEANQRYVLGPVLIPAQECYNGRSSPGVLNPTYELAYWRWALRTAVAWQERLGLEQNQKWQAVAEGIASPHVVDGQYAAIETPPFTRRRDHPSMLAALGVMPDVGLVDRETMNRTLDGVLADWAWPDTWGWDYPMMAMTAARLSRGATAVDCLLLDAPKNVYLANGHNRQEDRLPIYLPGNGGLLTAVGMMAAGWDDGPTTQAPGFPQDGAWTVRHEGLNKMP